MNTTHHDNVCELFLAACDLPADEQSQLLDERCRNNPKLRTDVERLLNKDDGKELALDDAFTGEIQIGSESTHARDMPERIGHYTLREKLGEGGMGIVYLAAQDTPHRTVALKVMKPGFTSAGMIRRFELETQVLARLHHPGIAQIYEAGTADAGFGSHPYFAMEYIHGRPLLDYVKESKLGTRERLILYIKVCQAVQHAHQHDVIHRDLKPANILVDDEGQPKILDFGIARSTDSDIQTTTLRTDIGQLIGTISYMSPEQVAGDPTNVDVRSDVYALGIVLYELLCEQLPHDLKNKTIPDAVRIIGEREPTPLSITNPTFRGDLETIVSKALEKDAARRYQSVANLALDIQRYLDDRPIIARPPSAIYQLRKFAKRNKILVGGIAATFLMLILGIIGTSFGMIEARNERNEAIRQAEISEAVNEFLNQDLLSAVSPYEKGKDVSMREVLDAASERIERATEVGGKFAGKPLVEAAIRMTMGDTYYRLGEYEKAEPHYLKAFALRQFNVGERSAETLHTMRNIGSVYMSQGRLSKAAEWFERALESQRDTLGNEDSETLRTMNALGQLYVHQRRFGEAEAMLMEVLEIRGRVLGQNDAMTLNSIDSLGAMYVYQGRYEKGEELLAKALIARREMLGESHPETASSTNNLGALYIYQAEYAKAEPLLAQTLEIRRTVLGDEHRQTLVTMINLAGVYLELSQFERAEQLYKDVVDISVRTLGKTHPQTAITMSNLGITYHRWGRYEDAAHNLEQSLSISIDTLGEDHPDAIKTMNTLSSVYVELGRTNEAEEMMVKTIDLNTRVLGDRHPETLHAMESLARLHDSRESYDKALAIHEAVVENARAKWPDGDWRIGQFLTSYGSTLTHAGKFQEAEASLLEAHSILLRRLGNDHQNTITTCNALFDLYSSWGKPEQAAEWRTRESSVIN